MFCVVAHEDRYEQREHEDGCHEVEHDKEESVALRSEVHRLHASTSHRLGTPHDVDPAFLRNDLEEDEERAAKIIEVVVWIGDRSRGQQWPVIAEWCAVPLSKTVIESYNIECIVVADFKLAVEEVNSVDSEWDQQR